MEDAEEGITFDRNEWFENDITVDDLVSREVITVKYSGKKRRRYEIAYAKADNYEEGSTECVDDNTVDEVIAKHEKEGNKFMYKRDEKIPSKPMSYEGIGKYNFATDGSVPYYAQGAKPRNIVMPGETFNIVIMPYEKILKKCFKMDMEFIDSDEQRKRFIAENAANFGTALSELSNFVNSSLEKDAVCVAALGDDGLRIDGSSDSLIFEEWDYSSFDATIRRAVVESVYTMFGYFGMPHAIRMYSMVPYQCKCVCKFRLRNVEKTADEVAYIKYKLTHENGEPRFVNPSGHVFTSLLATIANCLAVFHNEKIRSQGETINGFIDFGFKLKATATHQFNDIRNTTFLKTGFGHGMAWKLPSAIFKAGYFCEMQGYFEMLPYMAGVVLSWGELPADYPILGIWREVVLNLANYDKESGKVMVKGILVDPIIRDEWKIENVKLKIDDNWGEEYTRSKALDIFTFRYNINVEDIVYIENEISRINSVPWRLAGGRLNDLFARMYNKDY